MARRIHQPAVLELALDLDQAVAEPAQQSDADRLVVDEGAAAAVGAEHPPQHQLVFLQDQVLFGQQGFDRMAVGDLEAGRDLGADRTGADQALIGPVAERQAKGVEQDRLAGPGLPGQDAETAGKAEIQPVDQDDITDRQARKHRAP